MVACRTWAPDRRMTDAERQQRSDAGRNSYRVLVRRSLESATVDGMIDLDMAARYLTGARLGLGMNAGGGHFHRGITARHMFDWCIELGIHVMDRGKFVLLRQEAPVEPAIDTGTHEQSDTLTT